MAKHDGIDAISVSLAGGLTWAFGIFVFGLGSGFVPSWSEAVLWIGKFHLGYSPTILGALAGAAWGFADVFVGLYLFCSLYNFFHLKRK